MAKYKLKDLCEFITDGTHQTPEYCEKGGIKFLSSKDVVNQKINWDNVKYIPKSLHEKLYKRLSPRKDDILLAKNGTTGVAAIVDREDIFDVYVSLAVLRPLDIVYPKYLLYAINSQITKRQFDAGLKGVGVPNLHLSVIRETSINVVPKEKQKKICNILDKIKLIIDLENQKLNDLDYLIQSRFVEMFGDPVKNPLEWKVKKLKELSIQINSGNTPKGGAQVYVEKGITFFRSQNVWKDRLELEDIVYIDEQTHESMKRSSLKHGDILMTKTGRINTENSSLGRAALYMGKDDKANINGHVYFIRLKPEVNNKFILRILVSKEYRDLIRNVCVGGIDKRQLNKNHIENFPIICPPKRMIDSYISFVHQINKSKFAIIKFLYCFIDNKQSIIKPRPNTKESGKIRGGKPHADEF